MDEISNLDKLATARKAGELQFFGVHAKLADAKAQNEPDDAVSSPEFWYYRIELPDGRFTPGFGFTSVALTRNLLRSAKIEGSRCFDFGTMEALVPTLLAKRGAQRIVAVDAGNASDKVQLVKSLHSVDFEYYPRVKLGETVSFARSIGDRFDIVVLSGILYHVFSPLHLLGYARSLTRLGVFNALGWFSDH
jgi:hypothetical protein